MEPNKSIENFKGNNILIERVTELERENLILRSTLSRISSEITSVLGNMTSTNYENLIRDELQDNIKKQKSYLFEWNSYHSWCRKNEKHELLVDVANSYIKSLNATATRTKKRSIIQCLLRMFTSKDIRLRNVAVRIKTKKKYAMKDDELLSYLDEQKQIDFQDYVLQQFLVYFCARINSAIHLKWEHFSEGFVCVPDTKTGDKVVSSDSNFNDIITEYSEKYKLNKKGYVFYPDCSVDARVCTITRNINSRIRLSPVMNRLKEENPTCMFSSHIFRKSEAYKLYNDGKEELLKKVRIRLRHVKNSRSTNVYIK